MHRLTKETTFFLNCDIQQGLTKHVMKGEHVITTARQMAQTANVFNIPILVTEQKVKTFGPTVPEISDHLSTHLTTKIEKNTFSMINESTLPFLEKNISRKNAILYGLEAHVCIQQTCLDLLEKGYKVYLLVDGISSIHQIDRQVALQRLRDTGAIISTFQSVVFELMRTPEDEDFKKILEIVKSGSTVGSENRLIGL